MNSNVPNTTVRGGMSFSSMLTIVFVVLKLCKVINWSWWWVLSPAWIPTIIYIVLIIIWVIVWRKRYG